MSDIKKRAREMFDEEYKTGKFIVFHGGLGMGIQPDTLKDFQDKIIDLAIAERDSKWGNEIQELITYYQDNKLLPTSVKTEIILSLELLLTNQGFNNSNK